MGKKIAKEAAGQAVNIAKKKKIEKKSAEKPVAPKIKSPKKSIAAKAAMPSPGLSVKEKKLLENFIKVAREFVLRPRPIPLTCGEIMVRLNLPEQHKILFEKALERLVEEKVLLHRQGKYLAAKNYAPQVTGILRVHPRGFGFVELEDNSEYSEDIFIPKTLINHGIDGDIVEVEILNATGPGGKGPDGRVVAILSRSRKTLAGIIRQVIRGTAVAYVPLLGKEKQVVAHSKTPLRVGDRVVMKVEEWGDEDNVTLCSVTKHLGHISDPSKDIIAAIAEYEIRDDFPKAALEEAAELGNKVARADIAARKDLRDLECFTIDPDTAKDFDDALTLTKTSNGHYKLGVHIADVSHYVTSGSALDKEARLRCNSTYFPRFCVPMLPRELSENLCSLKEGVNRLTVSVLAELDSQGTVLHYEIVRSVICSAKRFTYKEAKLVLDGKKRSRHKETLNLMVELCGLLKKKRAERGSIEFSLPEFVIKIDDEGTPFGYETVQYDITHQLVEEFMLKANELVALHLSNEGKPLPYRVHDEPAEENLREFANLATSFGFHLPHGAGPADYQKLFEEALQTSYGPYLSTAFITRMRLATYAADNIGHYGLALAHYCHFTSPIRRYVDLVIHRLLFTDKPENKQRIDLVAKQCSAQERISAKAEGDVLQMKKLRYLQACYEKDPERQYSAAITRVKNFGLYFAVGELMLEGYFHVSELQDDFYNFDPKQIALKGAHRGYSYKAGQEITVMLKSVDLISLESHWHLVGEENPFERRFERKREHHSFSKKRKGKRRGRS
jgi:ribonuclease R